MHLLLRRIVPAMVLLCCQPAAASESVEFAAPVYAEGSVRAFMRNETAGEVRIAGTLFLPKNAPGPVPAVIIAHTSGGMRAVDREVAEAMNAAGFAALTYDSYHPRGTSNVQRGGGMLAVMHQTADAYAALKALVANPRIDARRIAILGMSAGGGAAILAASAPAHKILTGGQAPRFAAHVAFYPGMHIAPSAETLTRAPMLVIVGESDDYQKPKRTAAWVDYARRAVPAIPVEFQLIPGAPHSFLDGELPAGRWVQDFRNPSNCPIWIVTPAPVPTLLLPDESVRDNMTREEIAGSFKNCTTTGGSIGYRRAATDKALADTVAFLKKSFAAVQ